MEPQNNEVATPFSTGKGFQTHQIQSQTRTKFDILVIVFYTCL